MKRAIVLILDGVGIGELPDAAAYNDQGSNTLGNLAHSCGGLTLPILEKLGLGNIAPIKGVKPTDKPLACFGKMAEKSPGKDSTSGHWELFGLVLKEPFPTYPDGFPDGIIKEFETKIRHRILGNLAASGTEIIKKLGDEHIATKRPLSTHQLTVFSRLHVILMFSLLMSCMDSVKSPGHCCMANTMLPV